MDLDYRQAVVAGCGGDIGSAVCARLLDAGIPVLGLGSSSPSGRLGKSHGRFEHVRVDFAKLDALADSLTAAFSDRPPPDALVLAVGFGRFGSIEQFSSAQVRELIDVNLTSQLLLLRHLVPLMKRARRGRIVVVGSESALIGRRYGSIYSAAKFGLRGALQSLREELSARNVRATLINPGMVRTKFFDTLEFEPEQGSDYALEANDVADAVIYSLTSAPYACVDEINLSPPKNAVRQKKS